MVSAQATTEPAPEPRPGPTGMPCCLRPLDEVGDDQEVAGEAHLHDHVELVARAARDRAWPPPRAPRRPSPASRSALQPPLEAGGAPARAASARRRARPPRTGSAGSACAAAGKKAQRRAMTSVLSIASGRSANSARISLADLNRCSGVRRRRSRLGDVAAVGDAQQRVVRLVHRLVGEVRLVGRDQRQVVLVGQLDQRRPRCAPRPRSRGAAARHRAGRGTPRRGAAASPRPARRGRRAAGGPTGPAGRRSARSGPRHAPPAPPARPAAARRARSRGRRC